MGRDDLAGRTTWTLMRLKKLSIRAAKRAIPNLLFAIECLKAPPIPTLQTLGATLDSLEG